MDFQAVRDAINTILTTELTGVGKTFEETYSYLEPSPSGYPVAMIGVAGNLSEVRTDSVYNEVTAPFFIRIEVRNQNQESDLTKLLNAITATLNVFRKSTYCTLSGTVNAFMISPEQITYDDPQAPVLSAKLNLTARVLSSIRL